MESKKIKFDHVLGSKRLRSLRTEKMGVSYDTLSNDTGINKQSLKNYERAGEAGENGAQYSTRGDAFAGMSANNLVILASHFGVSTDYLLGLVPVETPDTDIRAINEYTGLSQRSVEVLHSNLDGIAFASAINQILESGIDGFLLLLSIENYLKTAEDVTYSLSENHGEFIVKKDISANSVQLFEIQERLKRIKGGKK